MLCGQVYGQRTTETKGVNKTHREADTVTVTRIVIMFLPMCLFSDYHFGKQYHSLIVQLCLYTVVFKRLHLLITGIVMIIQGGMIVERMCVMTLKTRIWGTSLILFWVFSIHSIRSIHTGSNIYTHPH